MGSSTTYDNVFRMEREKLKIIADDIKRHIDHIKGSNTALGPEAADPGEVIANLMLAYRHLEDASMRLGKAVQAYDGGKSCYTPKETIGDIRRHPDGCEIKDNLGNGHTFLDGCIARPRDEKNNPGHVSVATGGIHCIELPCLNCGKVQTVPMESAVGRGELNCFCSGECEDKYAFKQ